MVLTVSEKDKKDNIPTNLRLLMILEEVARAGGAVTPTEINGRVGLPKPTIHRLFSTLEDEGFLQREVDGRSYGMGPRMRDLASGVLASSGLRVARVAVLEALTGSIGETCNITIPGTDCMIYLDRVETKWPLRFQLPVGTQVPLYCTASGKLFLSTLTDVQLQRYLASAELERQTDKTLTDPEALLAEVMRIREQGYSLDAGEFLEGMNAAAVPINDSHGRMVSTLAVHGPGQRMSLEKALGYLPALRDAAEELSRLFAGGSSD